MNWHWPSTPYNGMLPWYWIVWRLTCFPVVLLGRANFAFGIGLGHLSIKEGIRTWEELE